MTFRIISVTTMVTIAGACGCSNQQQTDYDCERFITGISVIENVTNPAFGNKAGFGQDQLPHNIIGPPKGAGDAMGSLDVLSLGIGGQIVVEFGSDFVDGPGVDFIVFENAFYAGGITDEVFAEPAAVSISNDGQTWHSFACQHEQNTFEGCAGTHPVYSNPNNDIPPADVDSAGGDAFDMADVDVDAARFLRIVDLSTSGQPDSAGFDLDAVMVRYAQCQ